jgi:hypothetical protein
MAKLVSRKLNQRQNQQQRSLFGGAASVGVCADRPRD